MRKVLVCFLFFALVSINASCADVIGRISGITDIALPGANMPPYKEPGKHPTPLNTPKGSIKLPVVKIGLLNIATKDISFKPIRETGIERNYWAGAREACKANGMRLPTPEELDSIYLLRGFLGKFKSAYYWSSESFNDEEALSKAFYEMSIQDGGEVKLNGVMPKYQYDKPSASIDTTEGGLSFYQDKSDSTTMARCVR